MAADGWAMAGWRLRTRRVTCFQRTPVGSLKPACGTWAGLMDHIPGRSGNGRSESAAGLPASSEAESVRPGLTLRGDNDNRLAALRVARSTTYTLVSPSIQRATTGNVARARVAGIPCVECNVAPPRPERWVSHGQRVGYRRRGRWEGYQLGANPRCCERRRFIRPLWKSGRKGAGMMVEVPVDT